MSQEIALRPGQLLAPQLDYILFDGSSSMQSKWWASLGALDNFMEVLKAQNVASHGIVHVFDSYNLKSIQRDGLIADWATFDADPLGSTWGGTPLYDAINLMGRELRDLVLTTDGRFAHMAKKISIVIVTDGEELGSKHTSVAQARSILDWCRAQGWQVTFLGADFDNSREARLLGANEDNSVGVRKELLTDAGTALGRKRAVHAHGGDDISFTSDERKRFGGYLTDQSK